MTTVTAKHLRDNLSEYLDRLKNGEEIAIIRHSEIIGSLHPAKRAPQPNGTAIAAMLKRNKQFFASNRGKADSTKSGKQLYHQILDEKYGL